MIVWRVAFLLALPRKGTIAGAARIARVSRQTVYNLMDADAGFDAQVRTIIDQHHAEEEARRIRQARSYLQASA